MRVKVLNNGLNVADMANVSPDHAIAVDTLLASRVEVVRGASTLMHANASPAGLLMSLMSVCQSICPMV